MLDGQWADRTEDVQLGADCCVAIANCEGGIERRWSEYCRTVSALTDTLGDNTECDLYSQSVPRSKHSPSVLQKPVS